jgi:hypothetical protein
LWLSRYVVSPRPAVRRLRTSNRGVGESGTSDSIGRPAARQARKLPSTFFTEAKPARRNWLTASAERLPEAEMTSSSLSRGRVSRRMAS